MRITDSMRASMAQRWQADAAERMARASQEATTGLRVDSPSSDPSAYSAATKYTARLAILEKRGTTSDRARGDLSLGETALASAGDALQRAREIAIEMSNGTYGATERANAAGEVVALKSEIVALANSKGSGGYLFGGTKNGSLPFTQAGAFVGNTAVPEVEIADGVTATAAPDGASAFTNAHGGRDVFGDLDALAAALDANDVAGISAAQNGIIASHDQVVAARVGAGLSMERLDLARSVVDLAKTSVTTARASVSEIDASEAYTKLTQAHGTYERALAVTKALLGTSVLGGGSG